MASNNSYLKNPHSLMILPMMSFLHSYTRDLFIDRIRIEGKKQVRAKVLAALTNYNSITDPVNQRWCRLLTVIHSKKELLNIIDQWLDYFVGDFNPPQDNKKNTISGAQWWNPFPLPTPAQILFTIVYTAIVKGVPDYAADYPYGYGTVEINGVTYEYITNPYDQIIAWRKKHTDPESP